MATVQEFFAELPTRVDPARTAGMHNSFVFDVTGVGAWTVRVDDGAVTDAIIEVGGSGPAFCDRLENRTGRSTKMPASVLKAWAHRARAVRAMTVHAVIRNEKLRASSCRTLVSLIRIPKIQKFSAEWKSDREVFIVHDEAKAVSSVS